jgi:hypothetical protein
VTEEPARRKWVDRAVWLANKNLEAEVEGAVAGVVRLELENDTAEDMKRDHE